MEGLGLPILYISSSEHATGSQSEQSSVSRRFSRTIHRVQIFAEDRRQERLGSRAATHGEEEKNKNIPKERKKRIKTSLTLTGLHGRT